MYYPDEIVEEIRQKNDIVDVVSGYVRMQKKGSNYFGLCPFHNEKSPSFSVTPSKQMYYCFGCGAGGNVFTFIMEYENYSFKIESAKMYKEKMIESKETTIKHLMELEISNITNIIEAVRYGTQKSEVESLLIY